MIVASETIVYLSDNRRYEARVTDVKGNFVFLKWRQLGGRRWTHTSMTVDAFNRSGWTLAKKGGKRE